MADIAPELLSDDAELLGFPWGHLLQRTIVLTEHKLLFLPVPKAGCTSILWVLADLAGANREDFEASGAPEVSPSTAIHDMSRWPEGTRLAALDRDQRIEALTADGWLRCSLVRHPATRLWSGWQSKLLLREPRYVAMFGDRDWFPRLPDRPEDIIRDFRRFVAALDDPDATDVHWCVQQDLVSRLPINHVGRVERLDKTIEVIRAHLGSGVALATPRRENRALLSLPPGVYDEDATRMLTSHFAADFEAYGYDEHVDDGSPDDWAQQAATLLPAVRLLVDRHVRVGQLNAVARERGETAGTAQRLERRVSALERSTGATRRGVMHNREELDDYTIRWGWAEGQLDRGFTAVVRVKNEARPLPWVLPPLLRAVRRVIVVDNGSTDGTPDLAREIAAAAGAADRLDVMSYPFDVSRCGPEHLGTPSDSVHSLTYFYNWSFSHVRTAYALKWDGDMVLTESGVLALKALEWQLATEQSVVTMPRYPLYVADDRTAFLDLGLANKESWGWPNSPDFLHVKAIEWELPLWPPGTKTIALPEWSCVELKYLDLDEFAHWSSADFEATARTRRKSREWQVFHALKSGSTPPDGMLVVNSPDGRNVVDYVREEWLPAQKLELRRLLRQAERMKAVEQVMSQWAKP